MSATGHSTFFCKIRQIPLSHFQPLDSVSFVVAENIYVSVADEFLRLVGGVDHYRCCGRGGGCINANNTAKIFPHVRRLIQSNRPFGYIQGAGILVNSTEHITSNRLRCCGIIIYRCQTAATKESLLSNACHAVGDGDRSQTGAITESPISNAHHAVADGNRGQLQKVKALSPMLVTLLGMVTEVRLLQPSKANSPMLVTLYVWLLYVTDEGISAEVKPL